MVGFPYCGLEPLPTGKGDGDIWEEIIVIVGRKGGCEESPERMVGDGT